MSKNSTEGNRRRVNWRERALKSEAECERLREELSLADLKLKIALDPEESACPHCGAIAGCCSDYPNCPNGPKEAK